MTQVRLIKHEVVPKCGSYEVRFPDGKSFYFYWDDESGRRVRPAQMDSKQALEAAKAFVRSQRDKPK